MPNKDWYNHLERRTPYYGLEGETDYKASAASLTDRLFSLLEAPYTADDSPAGGEVTASVALTPIDPVNSRYDLITVNFLSRSDDFSGAPIIKVEMKDDGDEYDRIDQVSIHYVDDHYVLIGSAYDVSKDNSAYYHAYRSHLHKEIPAAYITYLEELISTTFKVTAAESSNL